MVLPHSLAQQSNHSICALQSATLLRCFPAHVHPGFISCRCAVYLFAIPLPSFQPMTRIFIVEDQDLMRSSMRTYLSAEDDFDVVGTAESGEETLEQIATLNETPDLVLIDVALPGMSGIELLRKLRASHPEAACLMLSGHAEEAYVEAARTAGAHGYLMKGQPDEYIDAIREIIAGNSYRSTTVASVWDKTEAASS